MSIEASHAIRWICSATLKLSKSELIIAEKRARTLAPGRLARLCLYPKAAKWSSISSGDICNDGSVVCIFFLAEWVLRTNSSRTILKREVLFKRTHRHIVVCSMSSCVGKNEVNLLGGRLGTPLVPEINSRSAWWCRMSRGAWQVKSVWFCSPTINEQWKNGLLAAGNSLLICLFPVANAEWSEHLTYCFQTARFYLESLCAHSWKACGGRIECCGGNCGGKKEKKRAKRMIA